MSIMSRCSLEWLSSPAVSRMYLSDSRIRGVGIRSMPCTFAAGFFVVRVVLVLPFGSVSFFNLFFRNSGNWHLALLSDLPVMRNRTLARSRRMRRTSALALPLKSVTRLSARWL